MSRSVVNTLNMGVAKVLKKRMATVNVDLEVKMISEMPEGLNAPFFVLEVERSRLENDIDITLDGLNGMDISKYIVDRI